MSQDYRDDIGEVSLLRPLEQATKALRKEKALPYLPWPRSTHNHRTLELP